MILTESEIKRLAKQAVREAIEKLNVRAGGIDRSKIENGITLYHRPKDSTVTIAGKKITVIESLFTYGFSREYTCTNGGNLYGPGIYTVYNLKSSLERARGYGSSIIKLKLIGGLQDFLVLSVPLAKQTYGDNWNVIDQIKMLFSADDAERIFNKYQIFAMHTEDGNDTMIVFDRDKQVVPSTGERSSNTALNIERYFGDRMLDTKCRGFIYSGGHDGDCCVITDFQSAIPVAVSNDNGETWEDKLSDNLINRINSEVDTKFQYGSDERFAEVADKSVNGFTMVWNQEGKVNYIRSDSSDPISDVWFDDGYNWEIDDEGNYGVEVVYKGYNLIVCIEGDDYAVYTMDGEPMGTLEELANY